MFRLPTPSFGRPSPKAEDGSSSEDLGKAITQVDELSVKLDAGESLIYGMLNSSIPKVEIKLPQLSPGMFSTMPADSNGPDFHRAPLLEADANPIVKPTDVAVSSGKKKAAEARAKAEAAAQRAEDARLEMEEQAKQALAEQSGMVKQLAGQGFACAVSLVLSVGLAYAQLGTFKGPMIAGLVSAFANFVGLALTWKGKADSIFVLVGGVFDKMTGKVVDVLDTVDDMILGPLQNLENAIDDLIEEQAPVLDNMKKFETGLKTIDPDFDLPDPEDLKKPLDGCDALIDQFVDRAKKEVPEKLKESVQSTFVGCIATDGPSFNRFVVHLPLAVILAVNMSLAVLQVYLTVQHTQESMASKQPAPRHLRGSAVLDIPASFQSVDVMPYIQPALAQIMLTCLQAAFALLLTQGPRICKLMNGAILKLQAKLNERVNGRIKEAVDRVFEQAFTEVKGKADEFFPKFKDSTKKLKQAMEVAAKTEAAAGGVAKAIQRLGF